MTGHRRAGQPVPVVGRPAEVRERRTDRQRRVRHAARDDDIRAQAQRFRDPFRAEVDIGAGDGVLGDRAALARQGLRHWQRTLLGSIPARRRRTSTATTGARIAGSSAASACTRRAAAGGLAAPKLPTMGSRDGRGSPASTGSSISSSSGSKPLWDLAAAANWRQRECAALGQRLEDQHRPKPPRCGPACADDLERLPRRRDRRRSRRRSRQAERWTGMLKRAQRTDSMPSTVELTRL